MSDLNTRMPSGSDVTQRTDEQPAFSEDLLESILRTSNIAEAWKRVRANKETAGIDGLTIDDFPAWAKDGNLRVFFSELHSEQSTVCMYKQQWRVASPVKGRGVVLKLR